MMQMKFDGSDKITEKFSEKQLTELKNLKQKIGKRVEELHSKYIEEQKKQQEWLKCYIDRMKFYHS